MPKICIVFIILSLVYLLNKPSTIPRPTYKIEYTPSNYLFSSAVNKEEATCISSYLLQKGEKRIYIRKKGQEYEVVIGQDVSEKEIYIPYIPLRFYNIHFYMKYCNEIELLTYQFLV